MIVFFVSECEKKAFTRTRRILNKYAVQLGSRTWQARLSEEGLDDIYHELRASATRQTSVACHRVRGHHKTALAWIVGNRQHFNEVGEFSFSQTRRDILRDNAESSHNVQLLAHLLSLAALCHDLGKANAFFQDKLKHNKKQRDPYRHEFVSCLILARVIDELQPADDKAWLVQFSDSATLQTAFNAVLSKTDWFDVTLDSRKISMWTHLKKFEPLPLLSSLLWLVLTHHKLPDAKHNRGVVNFDIDAAFFGTNFSIAEQRQAIHFESNKEMPWQNQNWLKTLARRANDLHYLLTEHAPTVAHQAGDLKIAIAHIARPFLILGDYQASAAKEMQAHVNWDTACFANTVDDKPADTLVTHLHKANKQASRCFRLLQGYADNPDFQSISEDKLPPIVAQKPQLKNTDSPFFWQEDSCQRIMKEHSNGIRDAGFFGIVAAKTGAGKTVAAARIMAQLSKELRFSLALGLRSLTLQAGQDYQNPQRLGFTQDQLAVMVGSKVSQALFEQQKAQEDKREEGDNGTFSDGIDDDDEIVYGSDAGHLGDSFPALNEKQLKMLATPILIATVDHLIAPTDGRRSKSTLMSLRLMTSDLILDEVDSYSYGDLVALGKLVYLVGLYGRKVLLVSATLPPALVIGFYQAYSSGYAHYLRLNNQEKPIFCGWFSDQYQFSQLKRNVLVDDYKKQHAQHVKSVVSHLIEQPAQRRAELLDVRACQKEDELFEAVLQRAFALHQLNHVIDEKSQARVSIGLVRWNNTKPCVAFSRYLLNRDSEADDLPFKVVCYHAKLLPIVLHDIEQFCHSALKRSPDVLTQQPLIQALLQQTADKDLVILIAATSIIEVGRDFDFDWGIFEPQSTRSLTQTAGRILRHRQKTITLPNVAVLSTTWRGLFKPEQAAYSYYGIETPDLRYRCALSSKQMRDVFDFEAMQQSMNAQWSLQEPSKDLAEISYHEHHCFAAYLEKDEQGRALQQWLDNADLHLHGYHSANNIFRAGLYADGLYLFRELELDDDEIILGKWRHVDKNNSVTDYDTSIRDINVRYENRLLLSTSVESALLTLKKAGFDESLLKKLVAVELDYIQGTPRFEYHDALGLVACE